MTREDGVPPLLLGTRHQTRIIIFNWTVQTVSWLSPPKLLKASSAFIHAVCLYFRFTRSKVIYMIQNKISQSLIGSLTISVAPSLPGLPGFYFLEIWSSLVFTPSPWSAGYFVFNGVSFQNKEYSNSICFLNENIKSLRMVQGKVHREIHMIWSNLRWNNIILSTSKKSRSSF